MDRQAVTKSLTHRSYREIDDALNSFNDSDLIELLDSRSRKVGDTAFTILERRGKYDLVKQAVLEGKVTTKLGKVRATNFFSFVGKKYASSHEVYLALLHDRNADVVSNALHGLVFLQDQRNVDAIRSARQFAPSKAVQERFDLALKALEKADPFLFSPGYHDRWNIWSLDRIRFAAHIGPF